LGTQLIISDDAVAVVREEEVAPKKEFRTEEYTVGRGDNLGSIAKKYNTSVDQLKEWNNRTDNSIQVGEKLVVNKTEVAVAAKTKEAVAKTKTKETLYHVRKGDSLFSISKKFPGVSIADIKRWNNIKGESITPGMKLKING
jgi:membrane-bound lytic murein transglycosylase D